MKRNGMCPICFVKRFFNVPSKVSEVYPADFYCNGAALTPPMGWSSWNTFRNRIDENLIYDTAVAMKEKGLVDAGYHFVNIDDNWVDNARDDEGRIQADKLTFPNGIPALVEKVNAMGISLGVYSSNGTATCEDLTASLYHEWTDAYTFAKWGVEYFKYDFCHNIPLSEYAPLVYAVTISKNGIGRTYDCKEAELSGLARYMKKKGFEGKYVSGLDRREGAMSFDKIEVEEDGVYNVTVHIVKHGQYEKCLMLEANGSEREVLIFPSQKRFNMTAKFTVSMRLKKGKNTLKLFNPIGTRADSAMLQYVNMGRQLKKATEKVARDAGKPEKPITFSICEWGFNQPYKWGRYAGNLWRTTPDIRPIWPWIKILYNHTVKLYKYAGVGGWNDPDMLEVGNGKLTFEQNRSHFALWCMMCAPLILGNDLRNISDDVLKIVKNPDLIAINQDALGVPAKRVVKGTVDVLVKPLADGSVAVCAFNKGGKKKYNLNLKKVLSDEYARCKKTENFVATNLWDKSETTTNGVLSVSVNKHDSAVFIVR